MKGKILSPEASWLKNEATGCRELAFTYEVAL
jgi:hypothetical protein